MKSFPRVVSDRPCFREDLTELTGGPCVIFGRQIVRYAVPRLDTIRAKLYRSTGLSNRSQRPNLKLDGTEPEHPARIHNMLNQQSFCRSTRPNQLPYKGSPEAITSCRTCRRSLNPACRITTLNSWFGVLAPAGVPDPVLAKIQGDIAAVLRRPDVFEHLTKPESRSSAANWRSSMRSSRWTPSAIP